MKTFYWLLKRELWEYRGSIVWAPLALACAAVVIGTLFIIYMAVDPNVQIQMDSHHQLSLHHLVIDNEILHVANIFQTLQFGIFSVVMNIVSGCVIFSYCLGALYNDRRDRSILFWKSMPVSDTATVLSKVVIAAVVAPIITTVVFMIGEVLLLIINDIYLMLHGAGLQQLLASQHGIIKGILGVSSLIPMHILWSLPAVGWLLLCSSRARSNPGVWAIVIPLIVIVFLATTHLFEKQFPNFSPENIVVRLLLDVFPATPTHFTGHISSSISATEKAGLSSGIKTDSNFPLMFNAPDHQIWYSTDLWIGVAFGILMIAICIWIRRWRTSY